VVKERGEPILRRSISGVRWTVTTSLVRTVRFTDGRWISSDERRGSDGDPDDSMPDRREKAHAENGMHTRVTFLRFFPITPVERELLWVCEVEWEAH